MIGMVELKNETVLLVRFGKGFRSSVCTGFIDSVELRSHVFQLLLRPGC